MKRIFKDRGQVFVVRQPLWLITGEDNRVEDYVFSTKKYAELYLRKVMGLKKIVWDGKNFARCYKSLKKKDDDLYVLLFKRWMVVRFGKETADGTTRL